MILGRQVSGALVGDKLVLSGPDLEEVRVVGFVMSRLGVLRDLGRDPAGTAVCRIAWEDIHRDNAATWGIVLPAQRPGSAPVAA